MSSSTNGMGDAGMVTIEATENILFSGTNPNGFASGAVSDVNPGGKGNAGGLSIVASTVEVRDGAFLSSSTNGMGDAGMVTIEATDTILFSGTNPDGFGSSVLSNVNSEGEGNAGDISIVASTIEVRDGAQLSSSTRGMGNGGAVRVEATDTILFSGTDADGFGSGAFSQLNSGGEGNAGDVSIVASTVEVRDGAQLSSSTRGMGNGGAVRVEATDTILFSGSGAVSDVNPGGKGNAGDVSIVASTVEVRDGAVLSSRTFGMGNGGMVRVEASDTILFSGTDADGSPSGAFSRVEPGGEGNAGDVSLVASTVEVRDGAALSSENVASFNAPDREFGNNFRAGNLIVQAESIQLTDEAAIISNTRGQGGNIQLNSGTIILRRNSNVRTNATGTFPGGNITMDTGTLAALENSDITANATNAAGGNVIINTQGIFGTEFREFETPQSDITATGATRELQGTVEINTPDVDSTQGIIELPQTVTDPRELLSQNPCVQGADSEFSDIGTGGFPAGPDEPPTQAGVEASWIEFDTDDRPEPTTTLSSTEFLDRPQPIVPARGWRLDDTGRVTFTADDRETSVELPVSSTIFHRPDTACSPRFRSGP